MAEYVIIDGKRVAPAVARAYWLLEAAFQARFGLDLIISDGVRTYEEQRVLYLAFLAGGTRAANPNSPYAYHVETNPDGARALDIRDSGNDAGVTRYGNVRSDWIRDNCEDFGFEAEGYHNFDEPWHIKFRGDPWAALAVEIFVPDTLSVDGVFGSQTIGKLQKVLGVFVDGVFGPQSKRALQARLGVVQDGDVGPATVSALQSRIGAVVDGDWGPATTSKLQEHLNAGGTLAAPVTPVPIPAEEKLTVDGVLGPATIKKLQTSVDVAADGNWGPVTTKALQGKIGATPDGALGPQTVRAIQLNVGATLTGLLDVDSIKKLQEFLNAGTQWKVVSVPPEPNTIPPITPLPDDEAAATPNLVTPSASDFPEWIRFETVLDPEGQQPTLNKDAAKYYGNPYNPIESHLHWWGTPGNAGTHDGNVSHIKSTKDLSVNFVVSQRRITLMVPINKIALTTGRRNPFAWKSENDPLLTDWQYKTMGYLHYIVEKLNPVLRNEPLRHHKEFQATSCSEIVKEKVRTYAEAFRTGALDPATGLPPVVVVPPVEPEEPDVPDVPDVPLPAKIEITKEAYALIKGLPAEFRALADDLDEYLV